MNYKKKLKIVRKYEPKMDDAGWINIEVWRLMVEDWRLKVEEGWKLKINKCKRLKIIEGVSEKMKVKVKLKLPPSANLHSHRMLMTIGWRRKIPVANFGDKMATEWKREMLVANFKDRMATEWRGKMPVANLGDGTFPSPLCSQIWRQIVSICSYSVNIPMTFKKFYLHIFHFLLFQLFTCNLSIV